MNKLQLWQRYQKHCTPFPKLGLALDLSRVHFPDDFFSTMTPAAARAFAAMAELESGAIANPDEGRMVGHYWLRNSALAPKPELAKEIEDTLVDIKTWSQQVHKGEIKGAQGKFKHVLVIGIGGSALGPQFVAAALGHPKRDKLRPFFFDNTDPDGMDKVLAAIGRKLGQTLCLVISKSGGTPETRNGMLEARAAFTKAGLRFEDHAVAITMAGSKLDQQAIADRWLRRFPMWDWVGGRTSETSAVGLLPAALQGLNIGKLIAGARACDEVTRVPDVARNPAMQLALMWHFIGEGRGTKVMVVIPYKDRLELFSRYLQQLIMESLGKEFDLSNQVVVNQGLSVFGNKGSTDQHAYIQQLRDGLSNFFVTFIEVLKDRDRKEPSLEVEPGVTSGDYLSGFLLGTRQALYEKGRQSITLTIDEVSPFTVGMLIALFERAVGFYASLVNINAYHQPGVQAGKLAADAVLKLQRRVVEHLKGKAGQPATVEQIARALGAPEEVESISKICEHLAANPDKRIARKGGKSTATATYVMA
ncbi:MAG: glucose-6-phosphate isomerase [Verrucomicrobia bacterium]|nr:glucose-6-phosphate isomerase [Verrucomicrobiota bacterium]